MIFCVSPTWSDSEVDLALGVILEGEGRQVARADHAAAAGALALDDVAAGALPGRGAAVGVALHRRPCNTRKPN